MSKRLDAPTDEKPDVLLAQFFQRNGYIRKPDVKRQQQLGWVKYKKGHEVRLVVRTRRELAQVRRLLRQVGLKPGKPFEKYNQIVQPIYGKPAVEYFLALARRPES